MNRRSNMATVSFEKPMWYDADITRKSSVAPNPSEQLGKYIQQRRKEIKMSLRELAQRAGYSHGSMSLIENGLRQPTPETLQNIAEALEIDYEDLYAISGISLPAKLPTFDAYLRTRYRDELTATDRRSLERYFDELRSKKGRGKGGR